MITKVKNRRLLLLNDLVVCVSVAPKASDDFGAGERLSLKWTYPVTDIEIQDTSASPTLSRLLTVGLNKGGSLRSNASFEGTQPQADNLCTEMSNLMHDYEVMSRISDLVGSLKGTYKDISIENTKRILQQIQVSIQQKDEEMAWVDSCCLQLIVKSKGGKEEVFTFQTDNPQVKKEWLTELRLAQLALDINNSPAWDVPEQEQRPSTKMPLFVKSQPVYKSQHQTEVKRHRLLLFVVIYRVHILGALWLLLHDKRSEINEETTQSAEFLVGVHLGRRQQPHLDTRTKPASNQSSQRHKLFLFGRDASDRHGIR